MNRRGHYALHGLQ